MNCNKNRLILYIVMLLLYMSGITFSFMNNLVVPSLVPSLSVVPRLACR